MKVVASVQAKRGSSRGLVHYLAHSKLDIEREPENGRELFNSFADNLSVESANNSIKMGIDNSRPSNDELHHLVLSFRPDDYRALGGDEKARRRTVKEVTRAAMSRLENHLAADRLSWAAAVHLNTANPHVHIAFQKQYFTKEIERKFLSKIPLEALPHHERQGDEKVRVSGFLIEGATERMEHLIDRERDRFQTRDNHEIRRGSNGDVEQDSRQERDTLRQGFLAEYELHRIESKIDELIENGDKIRFLVSDLEAARKRRLSLRDIEQRKTSSDIGPKSPPETQIRTILFKMLAKEEAAKAKHQSETADTIRDAKRLKERYRMNDWKLPVPSFAKDELDKLQDHYIRASDLRKFSYLESVRSELQRTGEIGPRDKEALGRIAAMKTIADLRKKIVEKRYRDFSDRRYYRRVEVGDKTLSLAQLDREENDRSNPVSSFVEKIKNAALRLSEKARVSRVEPKPENDRIRNDVLSKLDEQSAVIKRELRIEHKTVKILEKILTDEPYASSIPSIHSPEELAEIETLSLRLKLRPVYEENRDQQRTLIESAGSDSPAYRKVLRADPFADFNEYKRGVIGGRALAKEIIAKVELEKAKEDLNIFTESKRFQRFVIEDKKTCAVEFVSLHDVDLPERGTMLDRAVNELLESREHRHVRRTVASFVKEKQIRLKEEVAAAKDIAESAARYASEFKHVSLLGLRTETLHQPLFTSTEITAIEMRIAGSRNPKAAARLRTVLDSAADQPVRSLTEILRDFENPAIIPAKDKEITVVAEKKLGDNRRDGADDRRQERPGRRSKTPQSEDRASPDLLR